MRIPTHLRLSRHGVYYFRIVVPKAVRPAFALRPEIKTSLGTRNLKVAMVEARRLALAAYASFAKVKFGMTTKKLDPNDPSTWPTSADVTGRFEMTLDTPTPHGIEHFHVEADPDKPDDVAAAKAATLDYLSRRPANSPAAAVFFSGED
jgi:hypothetical protein